VLLLIVVDFSITFSNILKYSQRTQIRRSFHGRVQGSTRDSREVYKRLPEVCRRVARFLGMGSVQSG
jgi:hypothetical protein